MIETRNSIVCRELQSTYGNKIAGNNLTVFCVSNTLYWEKRDRPANESRETLLLSGILDVRRHCVGIVAEAQYQAALRYIRHKIPALLESLQLWVESGSGSMNAERKAAIRSALNNIEDMLNNVSEPKAMKMTFC